MLEHICLWFLCFLWVGFNCDLVGGFIDFLFECVCGWCCVCYWLLSWVWFDLICFQVMLGVLWCLD